MKLTEKQKLFVDALVGPAHGNATKAALMAGVPPRSARSMASKWLTKGNIQHAVAKRVAKREEKTDITNERIDQELASIGFSKFEHARDKNTSLKELNKVRGRHNHRMTLDLNVRTIEHLVVEARRLSIERNEKKQLKAVK